VKCECGEYFNNKCKASVLGKRSWLLVLVRVLPDRRTGAKQNEGVSSYMVSVSECPVRCR